MQYNLNTTPAQDLWTENSFISRVEMYYTAGLTVTTPSPLPDAAEGEPYSQTITADRGTTPYTWDTNITGLPPGITATSANDELTLSGTPQLGVSAGNYTFTVTVTDTAQETADKTFDLTVHPPPPEFTITSATLPLALGTTLHGTPGSPVSYTLDGDYLVADTTITAPTDVEVAPSNTGPWSSTLVLTSTPTLNETVWVRMTGAVPGSISGDITHSSTGAAGTTVEPLAVTGTVNGHDNLAFSRAGPDVTTLVDNDEQGPNGDGLVLLEFTATTSNTDWTINDITFKASGTADEQAAISEIGLYRDDGNDTWDGPSVDDLATSMVGSSFGAPDGDYMATLSNGFLPSLTTHRYFLVIKLAGQAVTGETFHAEVTNVGATSTGTGSVLGIPTNGSTPAFEVDAASMDVAFNGPNSFGNAVDSDSQGPGGDGHLLASVIVSAQNDSWTITDMTFTAGGTADEQSGLSFLALYLDDGNDSWDGPGTDVLAETATGISFDAPDGNYTAMLTAAAGDFAVNDSKTFHLVGKLSGTAVTNDTFRAHLTGMTESSPSGGVVNGIPSQLTSALRIDVASLSVLLGPGDLGAQKFEATGAPRTEVLAQFRFVASNGDFPVTGFNLSTGGGGDWVNHLDGASGVEVYHDDDGNGVFDGTEPLLYADAGNTGSMNIGFSSTLDVLAGSTVDVWLVLNFTASAGGTPSEDFSASIAAPNDVLVAGSPSGVGFGVPQPASKTISLVFFEVSNFDPLSDDEAGGAAIIIDGSGFGPNPEVKINGVLCPGTAVVDASGTQITGLMVPPGTGDNLPITIETNDLGVKTLPQQFSYIAPGGGGGSSGGGGGGSGGGGCTATPTTPLTTLLAALTLLGLAIHRRRRA